MDKFLIFQINDYSIRVVSRVNYFQKTSNKGKTRKNKGAKDWKCQNRDIKFSKSGNKW